MNAIFCFDWALYKDSEGNYYDITLTEEILNRYLAISDKLTLICRVQYVEDDEIICKLSKINNPRIEVFEVPNFLTLKGMLEKNKFINSLSKYVMENDLIFIRVPSFLGLTISKLALKYNKPYLAEVGGCAWDSYWQHSLKGKVLAPYFFFSTKKLVKQSAFTTYVTKEFLQRRYPTQEKQCSCSNVVISKGDSSILDQRLNKIKEMSNQNKIIIGTIAGLDVKYKGQQYIIEAISLLNKKGYNFEYHLLGKGKGEHLKELAIRLGISDKVYFHGVMKRSEVISWLDSIDIYAQPSKQEGLPRAVIEAMSRACPAIGSNIAGIPELLDKNYIFKAGNIFDICEKIESIIDGNMEQQAKINFYNSEEYDFFGLESKRNNFFKEYQKFIENLMI